MPPIAFYAPLKPPYHPTPSGDREIARLLIRALSMAGYTVELASGFRSFNRDGELTRQQRLRELGAAQAKRLIARYRRRPSALRPQLWITYHLYHKAPDWIGPAVAKALAIPYVVIEASYAAKQHQGPWQLGLEASLSALEAAALALCLNPRDRAGLMAAMPALALADLPPFIDTAPWIRNTTTAKTALATRYGLDPQRPWLISVAMMRRGDKLHSYRLLADALTKLNQQEWELLVVGSGEAEAEVRQAFTSLPQCHWLGQLDQPTLIPLLQACELMLWPAVNEAFGMVLLEAQATGLPVVAGDEGGVASILVPDLTGKLIPRRDSTAFAAAVDQLLAAPRQREAMGQAARAYVCRQHSLEQAAALLRQQLQPLLKHPR